MKTAVDVRHGSYHDSVTLMAVSRSAATLDGVDAAFVAMATELNRALLADMGFEADALRSAGPNDLVVALRAVDAERLAAAQAAVDEALGALSAPAATGSGLGTPQPPRTVGAAVRRAGANLVLVSVPGEHAFVEAMDALARGASVMVFSDNVPLEQEVALKAEAARRGVLVMGPDCGTAIVGGVGLGFANAVRPGPVGVVGASGTGTQQVCALLDAAGVGMRHVLGVGGRDLSREVGAASTLAALAALDADPGTEVIVVVSKPPASGVAERVREAAAACATPVVLGLVGPGRPDLTETVAAVLARLGRSPADTPRWPAAEAPIGPGTGTHDRRGPALRGLFAGGTLCDEAMVVAAPVLGPIASNIPLDPAWALPENLRAPGHLMIDFGEDSLTRGRPHPMIDQSLRLARIAEEADDPACGVLLLDVVLGYGAHPDPAAELAPAVAAARARAAADGRALAVVVSLCGTEGDPQGRDRQAGALAAAGACVHLSNAAAAREAVALARPVDGRET